MAPGRALALQGGITGLAFACSPALVAGQDEPPAPPAPEEQLEVTYTQRAELATFEPVEGTPRYVMKLHGVGEETEWSAEGAEFDSGGIPYGGLERTWEGFGFVEERPVATIGFDAELQAPRGFQSGGGDRTTVEVVLNRPLFRAASDRLRYSVRVPAEEEEGARAERQGCSFTSCPWPMPSVEITTTARVINGCPILPYTKCPRADLSGATLSRAYLSGAYLSGAYLSGAYLSGADLSGADLSGANLSDAHLSGADLSRAYLYRANLRVANLSGANLSGANLSADLSVANLRAANLSGATLSRAYLSGAYLSGAYLSGADLSGADLSGADLSGANLSGANFCSTRMPDGSINDRDCFRPR